MEAESIRDILHWSSRFHTTLAHRLDISQSHAAGERERMLMNYLSEHEQLLADNFSRFQQVADMDALKSWSYDYYKSYPKDWMNDFQTPYENMSSDEIIHDVEHQHQSVIDFYQNLKTKAQIPEVVDLLEQLIDMEAAEASSMAEASNRLEGI